MKMFSARPAISILLLALGLAASAQTARPPDLKQGLWRGEFDLNGDRLPFNFEIGGTANDTTLTLINGSRRDRFDVQRRSDGSLFVKMNVYDAALEARIESAGRLTGVYKSLVSDAHDRDLPFVAEHGKIYRFVEPGAEIAPRADLAGKWAIEIQSPGAANTQQIALLQQRGNQLGGVFMAVVGDTRELAGSVQGDRFYLSGFSGASPVLVKGTITGNDTIEGTLSFGTFSKWTFRGSRSAAAVIPDPYQFTHLRPGYSKLEFTFPDLEGRPVSLSDEKYRGKVVLVEIIGTWCPNCADQTEFLAPWFKANRHRGVEIIAIGFEQEDSLDYARRTLGRFKEVFDIRYDVVFGGIADKKVATEKLRALNFVAAFPTTILLDRKGEVREIHTGFAGKITGDYFENYVARFDSTMNTLLSEPNPYETAKTAAEGQ